MALESQRFEVLKLSLEERDVGVSQAKRSEEEEKRVGVKRIIEEERRVGFGLYGGQQRKIHVLGFMVDIIETIKIGLYGGDMTRNHFLFNNI